ncbi:MAG: monovalent cation/H+ antiporter complex subunit F [Clostridia bacterium]|nr:monovalent cation/H+ antiporter complex subunit F [Clostridia bacterium]
MTQAYSIMYNIVMVVLGVLLCICLIRAITGTRIADKIIAVNMMGTLILIIICVLAFVKGEGYLADVAIIYAMLSFLAVVILSKIYIGVYRQKLHQENENGKENDHA